jgi:chemotaxis signal transduction protein
VTTEFDNSLKDDLPSEVRNKLDVFCVGSSRLAVMEEQVLSVHEWSEPTPLPFAPESVLGIVSLEGRMFTVLDIGRLIGAEPKRQHDLIVAFRSDEQLAIAVDASEAKLDLNQSEVQLPEESSRRIVQGIVRHAGQEVQILDVNKLFAEVIQGRERRRRL